MDSTTPVFLFNREKPTVYEDDDSNKDTNDKASDRSQNSKSSEAKANSPKLLNRDRSAFNTLDPNGKVRDKDGSTTSSLVISPLKKVKRKLDFNCGNHFSFNNFNFGGPSRDDVTVSPEARKYIQRTKSSSTLSSSSIRRNLFSDADEPRKKKLKLSDSSSNEIFRMNPNFPSRYKLAQNVPGSPASFSLNKNFPKVSVNTTGRTNLLINLAVSNYNTANSDTKNKKRSIDEPVKDIIMSPVLPTFKERVKIGRSLCNEEEDSINKRDFEKVSERSYELQPKKDKRRIEKEAMEIKKGFKSLSDFSMVSSNQLKLKTSVADKQKIQESFEKLSAVFYKPISGKASSSARIRHSHNQSAMSAPRDFTTLLATARKNDPKTSDTFQTSTNAMPTSKISNLRQSMFEKITKLTKNSFENSSSRVNSEPRKSDNDESNHITKSEDCAREKSVSQPDSIRDDFAVSCAELKEKRGRKRPLNTIVGLNGKEQEKEPVVLKHTTQPDQHKNKVIENCYRHLRKKCVSRSSVRENIILDDAGAAPKADTFLTNEFVFQYGRYSKTHLLERYLHSCLQYPRNLDYEIISESGLLIPRNSGSQSDSQESSSSNSLSSGSLVGGVSAETKIPEGCYDFGNTPSVEKIGEYEETECIYNTLPFEKIVEYEETECIGNTLALEKIVEYEESECIGNTLPLEKIVEYEETECIGNTLPLEKTIEYEFVRDSPSHEKSVQSSCADAEIFNMTSLADKNSEADVKEVLTAKFLSFTPPPNNTQKSADPATFDSAEKISRKRKLSNASQHSPQLSLRSNSLICADNTLINMWQHEISKNKGEMGAVIESTTPGVFRIKKVWEWHSTIILLCSKVHEDIPDKPPYQLTELDDPRSEVQNDLLMLIPKTSQPWPMKSNQIVRIWPPWKVITLRETEIPLLIRPTKIQRLLDIPRCLLKDDSNEETVQLLLKENTFSANYSDIAKLMDILDLYRNLSDKFEVSCTEELKVFSSIADMNVEKDMHNVLFANIFLPTPSLTLRMQVHHKKREEYWYLIGCDSNGIILRLTAVTNEYTEPKLKRLIEGETYDFSGVIPWKKIFWNNEKGDSSACNATNCDKCILRRGSQNGLEIFRIALIQC